MDKETNQPLKNAPYDTQPAGLEKTLDGVFHLKAPFQLPANVTKWLADNSWWIVLVGAALSVLGIFSLLSAVNTVNQVGVLYDAYGLGDAYGARSTNALYISMLGSAISAVLLFMASSKLKGHQKAGWNLLYYNFLINAVVSLVGFALSSPVTLLGSLIGFVIGFGIGAYILFQLRGHFTK